jgi:hypothetical protein
MHLNVSLNIGLLLYDWHFGCSQLGPFHLEDINGPLSDIKPIVDRQMKADSGMLKE